MEGQDVNGREKWRGKFDYLLVMLGSSVGFGNFWRFPYVCARNGGGMWNYFNSYLYFTSKSYPKINSSWDLFLLYPHTFLHHKQFLRHDKAKNRAGNTSNS